MESNNLNDLALVVRDLLIDVMVSGTSHSPRWLSYGGRKVDKSLIEFEESQNSSRGDHEVSSYREE